MNKLHTLVAATFITFSAAQAYAAPADVPASEVPPAHIQKDQVPNSTENGNYLEPQATEDGAKPADKHHQKDGKHKAKGKNVTTPPKDGGAEVTPK